MFSKVVMTTKTIKTVLFASLLVAMILPFSTMEMADAAPNENANDNAHVNVNGHEEYQKMIDQGYKLFPGVGWVKADEHAAVAPIYMENPEKPGELILDLDAMQKGIEARQKSEVEHGKQDTVYPTHNGYNLAAVKQEPNSMTYFNGYWKVPAAPASWSGGTIFHFDALMPFAGVIFQPVLQYGNSDVCNAGAKWVTYAIIYIDPNTFNVTPCVDASVGDTLRGNVWKGASNVWTVKMYNLSKGTSAFTQVGYSGQADTALVALETYNLARLCSSIPGDERFYSMWITGDSVSWADGSEVAQWCGMALNIISDSTVELNNNN